MTTLMVPPKIARMQWNCRSFVTETLLFFRAVSWRTSPVSKLVPRPEQRGGVVTLVSRRKMAHVYWTIRISTFCAQANCESSVDMRWVQRSRPSAPPNETITARSPSVFDVTMVRSESLVALP